MKIKEPDPKKV